MSTFEAWLAEHPLVRDTVRDYAADCLRRLPSMTPQTVGANIRLDLRTLVDMAKEDSVIRHLGWGDQIDLPQEALRIELLAMVDDLGPDWHLFDETAFAENLIDRTCAACGGPFHRATWGCVRPRAIQTIKRG